MQITAQMFMFKGEEMDIMKQKSKFFYKYLVSNKNEKPDFKKKWSNEIEDANISLQNSIITN